MYLGNDKSFTYYNYNGEQRHSRGNFLILMSPKGEEFDMYKIRAVVRKVALSQLGHWMMGTARIGKKSYTVSGAYGNDGLALDVERDAYNKGLPVPPELIEKWNKGGGWNGAGSEAAEFRKWAIENLDKLTPSK